MSERDVSRKLHVCIPDRGHQTIPTCCRHGSVSRRPPIRIRRSSPSISATARRRSGACAGEEARLVGAPGEIFPNTALLSRQPRTMAVWHPRSPHQTECWRWFFVDRDAPSEVKNFLRDYYIRYSGPAGMTEQDDMENWNYAHAASRGTIARRYPYNYEQGMRSPRSRTTSARACACPARSIDLTEAQSSEQPMRNFYRRWAEFMEADELGELTTWRGERAQGSDEAAE